MTIIDTHAHIYSEDILKYPQVSNPYLPPTSHGTLDDLLNEKQANNVDRVVVVQTFSTYKHDNRLIIDTVCDHQNWMTGVLNVDPFDPTSIDFLKKAASNGIRGNRVSIGWHSDGSVIDEYKQIWNVAQEKAMIICALLDPPNCQSLAKMLSDFPDVPVVLDHCANLKAKDTQQSKNLKTVMDLAQYKNLYAKLSFLITGSNEAFPCRDSYPVIKSVIGAYSPERCTWGSDFPTSLWSPKVTYQQHLEIFNDHLGLSSIEKETILGETAMRLWFT
jgi:predicted TIM-barrel fold metal-dependent hydrolase